MILAEEELISSPFWYSLEHSLKQDNTFLDCVIYNKLSISRNLNTLPYPPMKLKENISFLSSMDSFFFDLGGFLVANVDSFSNDAINVMTHKGLLPIIKSKKYLRLFLEKEDNFYILLNHKNHINISSLALGLGMQLYSEVDRIDLLLEKNFSYAFSFELGYLSKEINNLGTSLKLLSVLYLPFLRKQEVFQSIKSQLNNSGFDISEFNFNSSGFEKDLFIFYSKSVFGILEEKFIAEFNNFVEYIANLELKFRINMYNKKKHYFNDLIFRAWAILENSVLIDKNEFLELVGIVLMGFSLDIKKTKEMQIKVLSLLFDITDTYIAYCRMSQDRFLNLEDSYIRSALIKERLFA